MHHKKQKRYRGFLSLLQHKYDPDHLLKLFPSIVIFKYLETLQNYRSFSKNTHFEVTIQFATQFYKKLHCGTAEVCDIQKETANTHLKVYRSTKNLL